MRFFCVLLMTLSTLSFCVGAQQFNVHDQLDVCKRIQNGPSRLSCYDAIEIDHQSRPINTEHQSPSVKTDQQSSSGMPVLFADLEEPRIFSSLGKLDFREQQLDAILLGVGVRKKLKSFDFFDHNNSIDFTVFGMINSQFDVDEIDTRNNRGGALINTDFMVGGELVRNISNGYVRLRYAHKSTHLGDEFLIDNPDFIDQRLNLSYEKVDIMRYGQFDHWGLYGGVGAVVRSEPGSLGKWQLQSGIQYIGQPRSHYVPIIGVDFKSWQASNWHLNSSLKAGIEWRGVLDHPVQLVLEYFEGKSPYGQFIREDLRFLGFSLQSFW